MEGLDPELLAQFEAQKLEWIRNKQLEKEQLDKKRDFYARVLVIPRYPQLYEAQEQGLVTEILKGISKVDENALERLRSVYGETTEQLESIILGPNSSRSGLGGFVLTFPNETIVRAEDAIHMTAPFGVVMFLKVNLKQDFTRDYREHLKSAAQKVIERLVTVQPPSVDEHFDPLNPFQDKAAWKTFLPLSSAHVGLYQDDREHGGDVYLSVSSNAGYRVANDLSALIHSQRYSARHIARLNVIRWAKDLSKRNAKRILYLLVQELGIEVNDDDIREDINAFVPKYHIRPRMLEPDHMMVYNTIKEQPELEIPSVSFFHDMAEGTQSALDTLKRGYNFILGEPYEGIKAVQVRALGMQNNLLGILPLKTSELIEPQQRSRSLVERVEDVVQLITNTTKDVTHVVLAPFRDLSLLVDEEMSELFGLDTSKQFHMTPVFVFVS